MNVSSVRPWAGERGAPERAPRGSWEGVTAMICEMRQFYRGQQKTTGLEILIFAATFEPGQTPKVMATDIDGEVIWIPYDDVKLNWRWNRNTNEWDDLDPPLTE